MSECQIPVFLIAKYLQDTGSEFTADLLPSSRSRLSDPPGVLRRLEQGESSLKLSRSGIAHFHFVPDFGEQLKACRYGIAISGEVCDTKSFSHRQVSAQLFPISISHPTTLSCPWVATREPWQTSFSERTSSASDDATSTNSSSTTRFAPRNL